MLLLGPTVRTKPIAVLSHAGEAAQTVADFLPAPPTDGECDQYLQPQRRWVPAASALGAALIAVSLGYLLADQPWAWPFFVVLALTVVSSVLSVVTTCRRRRDSAPSHRHKVAGWKPDHYPSVDVFLPTAGEPLDVLANTYRHVANLSWPGVLTVYVLDDGSRSEVLALANCYGFVYLARPDRGHLKKAGNLRYGFQRSNGDLITIFDADFVPRTDFLAQLVPYFDSPDVGIVQSPQYFDLRKQMNWVQLSAGATQVLFYQWIQPSWDRSDASICVGTCAVYRRAALAQIGGFPAVGHSEDVYTGVELLQNGYRQRYVPAVLAKGLCPYTLDAFLSQQYRWCSGSLSLLFSRQFHRSDFSLMQRLSFWSGFSYYLDTAVNVFLAALPPILLAIIAPAQVQPSNYLFVLLAICVRAAIIPFISAGRDSVIGLARIQTAYSFAHAVALFDVIRGRTAGWQATGSAKTSPTARRVRRLAMSWSVGVQVLLWCTIAWRAPEFGWAAFSVMAVLAVVNLVTVYPLIIGNRLVDPMAFRRRLPGLLSH
jgi:cellulose synthase (UDP-forming)